MHCAGCSRLDGTERLNWRNHLLVHWREKTTIICHHAGLCGMTQVIALSHTDPPFVQHDKVHCKYRNIEEKRKRDESNNPSQEMLANFHLDPQNTVKPWALCINTLRNSTTETTLLFTRERLRSPKSLQRSQTVFSPTSRITNRPTNFTPSAPARFTPVSSSHSHQEAVNGLKKTSRQSFGHQNFKVFERKEINKFMVKMFCLRKKELINW